MENVVRIPEAAKRLGVSVDTVRRLIDRGELPASRVLRAVVIRPEDIDAFLDRSRIAPRPSPAALAAAPKRSRAETAYRNASLLNQKEAFIAAINKLGPQPAKRKRGKGRP